MLQVKQVTVIGTGLLGASLALALRERGYTGPIVGVGRREATLAAARELGCFSGLTVSTAEALEMARDAGKGGAGPAAASQPAALGDGGIPGAHLAVLAAPLGHFEEIFRKLAPCDDPGLIVTDVGSTKASVCEQAERLLPDASRFVGSHPMAGSEQTGPGAAEAKLFEGKPCVVTPGDGAKPQAVELVESLWRGVGMKLVRMTPAEHDRSVALVSHLPHAVAALLVRVAMDRGVAGGTDGRALGVASTGFADTTRIAAGDPGLWVDIFETNHEAVLDSIDRFGEALREFRDVLVRHDNDGMMKLLDDAKQVRDNWGCKRQKD